MSLKTFHIVFVIVSTILAVGFGLWAIGDYRRTTDTVSLVIGVLSLVGAVCLIVYGRWFLRKLRGVSGV